ncbi:hypothetical protein D9611_006099 [Ephemerocybe angulata]|uniref:Fungal-type protein kinase domain-containing protein n=1 Tax=Ephemerocybe angulata TaxID=980116 RepID=A0A8H5CGT0_9AGAR|nr:hypothetical protein D9611_006099 [Tulosesus angulatus]
MSSYITQTDVSRARTRSQTRAQAQSPPIQPLADSRKPGLRNRRTKLSKANSRAKPAVSGLNIPSNSKKAQPRTAKPVALRFPRALGQRPYTRSVAAANRAQRVSGQGSNILDSIAEGASAQMDNGLSGLTAADTLTNAHLEVQPAKPSAQRDESVGAAQRKTAISDLHDLQTVDSAYFKGLYEGVISDRKIKDFLASSSFYDHDRKRWSDLPRAAGDEGELYAPFQHLISAIIGSLGNAKGSRQVVDTHNTDFAHMNDPNNISKPTMAIRATGPSFSEPPTKEGTARTGNATGFENVASVFDVRREADVSDSDVDHLTVYNRQIFFHQWNRLFCRSLLLTETNVRLVHTDRSGSYKTEGIDIHEDPYTFVRLIVGLSSTKERVLGLDTSVQWTVKDGVRTAGTICTRDASGKRVKYQLVIDEPLFVRFLVRGTGSVCWNAKDKNGSPVLVKDAWRVDIQTPEYTFLEQAKGVEGVAQMLSVEDDRIQTKTLRPTVFESEDFYNRTMSRVTMRRYGSTLNEFTSQHQAIAAIRDAIQGHYNLLKAHILHRDVSMGNILIGDSDEVGRRGVLIDLDLATVVKGAMADSLSENRVGTRLYSSYTVLKRLFQIPVAHDYLDDLESFLYVLSHLFYGFEGVNRPAPAAFKLNSLLSNWETLDPEDSASFKYVYLSRGWVKLSPFWNTACFKLLADFRKYLLPLFNAKITIRNEEDDEIREVRFQELYKGVDVHYADIIAIFDTALEELSRQGGDSPRDGVTIPANVVSAPLFPRPAPKTDLSSSNFFKVTGKRGSSHFNDIEVAPVERACR